MIRVLSILFVFLQLWLSAQVAVTITSDTTQVLIGDPINLELRAKYDQNVNLEWPFLIERIGEFDILESGTLDTISKGTSTTIQQNIRVSVYDTGYFAIPGIVFNYKLQNHDSTYISRSEPILIRSNTFEIDTSEIKIMDAKPIMEIPVTWVEYVPLIVTINAILVALALLSLLVFLWRRKPAAKETEKIFIPNEAPSAKALRKLISLDDKKLWQSGLVKEYYAELSYIFREYLEYRFDIHALESVTDEILSDMKQNGASAEDIQTLNTILSRADLVKYAKAQPSIEFHVNAIDEVKHYIDRSKAETDV